MINAYTRVLQNYVVFSGRAGRSEFWLFVLAQGLIVVVGLILADQLSAIGLLLALYLLGTLIPTLAATVRRLHDSGRNAWWLLLGIVPAPVSAVLVVAGILFLQMGIVGEIFSWVGLAVGDTAYAEGVDEVFGGFFELGVALLSFGVLASLASIVLAFVLLMLLSASGQEGENKYGPQPDA